jgi:hypothetical protein
MLLILKLRKLPNAIFFIVMLTNSFAFAEYRIGGFIGFGGTGIKSSVDIDAYTVNVERSDGPGIFQFVYEKTLSQTTSWSFEHTQGFSLSPFSSGVGFTGFSHKWYYPGEIPSVVESKTNQSTLMMKSISPYFGLGAGLSKGTISRQKDLVSDVSASGVYFGFHIGADYQLRPNVIFRNELVTFTSLPGSGAVQSTLSAFGLMSGLVYIFD